MLHQKKYPSLPKDENPMTITIDKAIEIIVRKRKQEEQRHIKTFEEDAQMEVLNGRYGPYLAYDGKNYHIDKKLQDQALSGALSYEECMEIVRTAPEPKARRAKR